MRARLFLLLSLALGTDSALAQDRARGAKVFEECQACHRLEKGGENTLGPSLHGVFGRKAGALDDFRYSPAMKKSGITWTPQTLDAYIADPQMYVPMNRMPYAGVPNARDRADLLLFMEQAFK